MARPNGPEGSGYFYPFPVHGPTLQARYKPARSVDALEREQHSMRGVGSGAVPGRVPPRLESANLLHRRSGSNGCLRVASIKTQAHPRSLPSRLDGFMIIANG